MENQKRTTLGEPVFRKPKPATEETVSMTMHVPVSIHTRMKIAAAAKKTGLYKVVIDLFDKSF